jgi:hypothetical protein
MGGAVVLSIARTHPDFRVPILLAFFIRISIAFVDSYIVHVPGSGGDSLMFEAVTNAWASDPLVKLADRFTTGTFLITWLAAALYELLGSSAVMIKALMALLGTLTTWNIYRTLKELWGEATARRVGWIAVVYPTLALFSGVFLRESPIAFFVSVAMLHLVWGVRGYGIHHLVIAIVSFAMATAFHTAIVVAIPGLLAFGLIQAGRSLAVNYARGFLRNVFLLVIATLGIAVIGLTGWGLDRVSGSFENLSFETIENSQVLASRGGAVYLEGFTVSSPIDLLWKGPVRMAYFLFSPFPWMVRSPNHLLGLVDALLFLLMTVAVFRARHRVLRDPAKMVVLIVFLSLSLAFSLGTSNFGTGIRHRAKIAPLLISLVAVLPWDRRIPKDVREGPIHSEA